MDDLKKRRARRRITFGILLEKIWVFQALGILLLFAMIIFGELATWVAGLYASFSDWFDTSGHWLYTILFFPISLAGTTKQFGDWGFFVWGGALVLWVLFYVVTSLKGGEIAERASKELRDHERSAQVAEGND